MKFISNYRVCYNGRFYEAGSPFQIRDEDADTMQKHGTVLHEPSPKTEEGESWRIWKG